MLTVIVPIYKVELYIEKCVRSLMEQTVKDDIEFLFINDCTPDKSMDILNDVIKEYPNRQHQIRILHNEHNLGVSNTRKKALDYAKGDYVGWCDSDDWCEPDMFQTLIDESERFTKDIVICNYWMEEENGSIIKCEHEKTDNPKEAIELMMIKNHFPWQLWETIMRKELLIEGFKKIHPTMSGEDCYAAMIAFYYAKSITYVRKTLYHHQIISTSLTQNIVKTREEWDAQMYNTRIIEKLYGNKERYFNGFLNWKIYRKKTYIPVFTSLWDFYTAFPEIERTRPIRYNYSILKKLIYNIICYFFPFYWIVKRKYWKRNKMELFGEDFY